MSYLLRMLGKGLAGDFTGYLSKFLKAPAEEDLETLQEAVRSSPRRADLHLAVGLKQMELGRLAAARECWSRPSDWIPHWTMREWRWRRR